MSKNESTDKLKDYIGTNGNTHNITIEKKDGTYFLVKKIANKESNNQILITPVQVADKSQILLVSGASDNKENLNLAGSNSDDT